VHRKLDQEAFEEKCIQLYGANSYSLFGSSILLDAMVELVKSLVADVPSAELSRRMIDEYFAWAVCELTLYCTHFVLFLFLILFVLSFFISQFCFFILFLGSVFALVNCLVFLCCYWSHMLEWFNEFIGLRGTRQ
jgi:hypothetical protein